MNLAAIVEDHPADAVALVEGERATTFGELREQVARARGGLHALGVELGDRVAVAAGNVGGFVVAHLAAMGVGAVTVPLNPLAPGPAIAHELREVGARVLVAAPQVPTGDVPGSAPELEHVVVLGSEAWASLLGAPPAPLVEREDTDLAVLLFTSGTVGAPRPAMLTHGNLGANLRQITAVPLRRPEPGDAALGVLPLFHVFGLNVVLHLALATGTTVVLEDRFDPTEALGLVRRHRITHVAGAPAMWAAWLALPDAPADAFASVRVATSGAAKLPLEVAEGFEHRFGLHLDEGYGLTETSPVVTSSTGVDAPRGSVGVPLPEVQVKVVDADGHNALQHDPGEIWVRGPNVFGGYWGDPEASERALTSDGWLRTGDIGVVDEHGNLFLVDRAKELIIVSGFNVFPAEVEEVLLAHPGVAGAAVVGVPDERTGEAVKAWVVPASGAAIDAEELHATCRQHLARYKCPTSISASTSCPPGSAARCCGGPSGEAPRGPARAQGDFVNGCTRS